MDNANFLVLTTEQLNTLTENMSSLLSGFGFIDNAIEIEDTSNTLYNTVDILIETSNNVDTDTTQILKDLRVILKHFFKVDLMDTVTITIYYRAFCGINRKLKSRVKTLSLT